MLNNMNVCWRFGDWYKSTHTWIQTEGWSLEGGNLLTFLNFVFYPMVNLSQNIRQKIIPSVLLIVNNNNNR